MGRVTLDVIRGMGVAQIIGVGHIDNLMCTSRLGRQWADSFTRQ